jgi:hypothetical protein
MPRTKTPIISLEEVNRRFGEWRQNRKGKAPIPDELWAAAVEVARKEGVSRTSTALRVEWNELKRRLASAKEASQTQPPAFVELIAPLEASFSECSIELEGRGRTLRIQLKNASASHVAALSRELWETAF